MSRRQAEIDALFQDLAKKRDKKADQLRTLSGKADFLEETSMPVQAHVLADKSRKVAVRCPRRAGKTFMVILLAIIRCLRKPNQNWLIIGLTRPSIEKIVWHTLLRMNEDMDLGGHPQHTKLVLTFPNGSMIHLAGAETRSEIEKLRGQSYDGVVIDESKSFNPVIFKELVYDVLEPATDDRAGQLYLIGTPGEIMAGPFYEATCRPPVKRPNGLPSNRYARRAGALVEDEPAKAEWSLHTWTRQENIRVLDKKGRPALWPRALRKKALMGWGDDHPTWLREYLGEWAASDDLLVYRYRPDLHDYDQVITPENPLGIPAEGPWTTLMGIDPGFKDPTAIVVWAYSPNSPVLWEVYSEKREKQNGRQLAEWIRDIEAQFGEPDIRVIDAAGRQFVETLADDPFGIATEMAEKKDKYTDGVPWFNTALDTGNIRIRRDGALSEELLLNRWLESSLGTKNKKEDDRTPNDLCDAALYSFRYSHHHRYKPAPEKLRELTKEWWDEYRRQEREDWRAKIKARLNGSGVEALDKDWW